MKENKRRFVKPLDLNHKCCSETFFKEKTLNILIITKKQILLEIDEVCSFCGKLYKKRKITYRRKDQ